MLDTETPRVACDKVYLVLTEYSVHVVAVVVAGQRLIPFSGRMTALFVALLASLRATIRSRLELAAEILALRHQLAVLQRTTPTRPRLCPIDRQRRRFVRVQVTKGPTVPFGDPIRSSQWDAFPAWKRVLLHPQCRSKRSRV